MEQIIDLIEGIFPGPRGPQGLRGEPGKQGLAGVGAVPADEAVADWINKTSATNSALKLFHWQIGETVDVRSYGAVGDGVSDDTAAIRKCVTDNAGRTIIVPPGTWLVTDTIVVPEHTSIMGVGDDSVILFNPAADPDFTSCFSITDGGFVSIRNIGFRSGQDLLHLRYLLRTAGTKCHDITIDGVHAYTHCILWAGEYSSVSAEHNHGYLIRGCRADQWKQLHVPEKPITTAVVELYNVDDFIVDGNIFVNAEYAGCGIQWWGGAQDEADYTATGGTWCHNGIVSNNIVRHTQWSPIWGSHGAQMIIANNIMSDCSDVCLSIEAASDMVVIGNHMSESNNGLVSFANSLRHVVFAHNTCTQSGQIGRATAENPDPRQRFRIFIRWGCQARRDIADTNSLDIIGNKIVYQGAYDAANTYNFGIMELGGYAGRLRFVGNTVVNTGLNLFARWLTGEWGLGDQNRNLWPGQWEVSGNTFEWDDAEQRLAGSIMRDCCIYAGNPFHGVGIIRGNTIRSKALTSTVSPICLYHVYTYRESGQEKFAETAANKGSFLVDGNLIENFAHACALQTRIAGSVVSMNVSFMRNHLVAPSTLDVVDLTENHGANMLLADNTMTVLDSDGNLTWDSVWPTNIPTEAFDKLIAVGTDIEPRGGVWQGSYLYKGLTKKSDGWYYYGQFKPKN